jgi:peroxiredoxin Q/BCP
MLKAGDAAPEFSVPDHAGKTHTLKDYQGKRLVLWFYPKADTPGCTAEGCSFRDLAAEYAKKNAAILGVSLDTQAENADFAKKFSFQFPLLCDTTKTMALAYGAIADASAGNANRIGVVIGPDGRILEWHPKVSAKDWPSELIARL